MDDCKINGAFVPDPNDLSLVSIPVPDLENKTIRLRLYKRRYFYLFLVSFGSLLSSSTFSEYSIIADLLKEYYGVSYITIEWTSMVILTGYLIPVYPSIVLFEKKGLKYTFVTGVVLVATGMWIEGAGSYFHQFWLILFGQCVVSSAQCCFVNLTPQFASYWFNNDEVATACAVGLFCNQIGMALSCIFSPFLSNNLPDLSLDVKLSYLNFTLATVTTLLAIIIIFWFEERPPLPPSKTQCQTWNTEIDNFSSGHRLWTDIKDLFGNSNFVIHLVSASMLLSFLAFCITILNQLLVITYPGRTNDIGTIGLLMYFMGIPGSLCFGLIVDKTHKYKEALLANNILTFLSLCFFVGSIYLNMTVVYIAAAVFGFFMVGYINLGLEMASEISYPVNEVSTSSVVLFFGCLLGIVMTYITNWLLEDYNSLVSLVVLLVYCFIGMFISVYVATTITIVTIISSFSTDSFPKRLLQEAL